ncbi:MAG TPA: DUF1330 domain-containing protein [Novosphingobium sp.]|nr:DUF1330 domain-containing protein [Novosphingobium sp.]
MAAYMIFIREGEIVDADAMAQYQSGNRSGGAPAGMKPLVVYGAMETVEGEPADGLVVLEFPDKQAAKDWYYGEDYQARAKFRQAAAPYRAFIVEGL